MKHANVRKGEGYCCQMCDGPYAKYKKKYARKVKRKDARIAKRRMKKDIEEMAPRPGLEPGFSD